MKLIASSGADGDPNAGKAAPGGAGATISSSDTYQAYSGTLIWESSAKLPDFGTPTYKHEGKPATVK